MANTQSVIIRQTAAALCLLLGTLTAGAQQWHTTVEISYPAEISLPQEVNEVLLVNNTVAHPDVPMGAFFTLMATSEMLEGSDYLPSVLETSQNESGSLYRKQLLSSERADSLMRTYNSDALIVLNQQILYPSTECYQTEEESYYAYTQVIAASHWTLFYRRAAGAEGLSTRTLIYADTLYWISEAQTQTEAVQALPEYSDARNEMCLYVGERFAAHFLPQTETADRYLYDVGKDDEGMVHFTHRRWQQAIDAWSVPQKDKKLSAYAAANCAVAYEILGDLAAACAANERAIAGLDELRSAEARQQAVNIRYYLEQLKARMRR